tara:strand:- start:923 stop:1618 length:696 start_codon:yes stop_codon:yes gene_type:complete
MRSQVYAWNGNSFLGDAAGAVANSWVPGQSGVQTSIFIGGFGNNITKPAETTATEFVVIEDVSCTPSLAADATTVAATTGGAGALAVGQLAGFVVATTTAMFGPRAYVQVRINTTDYFLNPDNVTNDGIPGTASPYPRSLDFQPSFNLYPDVYVLPGQVWDVRYTAYCAGTNWGGSVNSLQNGDRHNAFCKYTLYDGPDALIANKLLEMGISINPGNVDWYKRSLLSAQGM